MRTARRASRARADASRPESFTLLEILLASASFAVIGAALVSVFSAAAKLSESAETRIQKCLPRSAVAGRLREDLVAALPPAGLLIGGFVGETQEESGARLDRLEFFSAAGRIGEELPWAEVQKITYYLSEDDSGQLTFVRTVARNLLAEVVEEPTEERLLSDVEALEITYWDEDAWADSWDSAAEDGRLPSAVRVRITFAGDAEAPPSLECVVALVAEPRATAAASGAAAAP